MISDQVKDYLYGMYGQPPAPIDKKVQELGLKGYSRGQVPTRKRPADLLEPGMKAAREDVKGLAKSETDVLIAAIYPVTGKRFLRWKYGLEPVPENVKPKTLEDVKRENEFIAKALRGELVEKPKKEPPAKGPAARTFNVFVDGEHYEVAVDEVGGKQVIRYISQPPAQPAPAPAQNQPATPVAAPPKAEPKPAPQSAVACTIPVTAPMPGMIINVLVKEGDTVKAGDPVVILEAMKVENTLTANAGGTVMVISCKRGDSVKKGEVLVQIG
jgi:pyruvate carboxylase subunit B